jgi:hypothetical protein
MAAKTQYPVIPFVEQRGALKAEPTKAEKTADAARRTAERLGVSRAGAVVLEQVVDAAADVYGEPKLIHQVGRVPEGFIESLAA